MRGFTLQETMIVLLIGALVTAASLPIVRHAMTGIEDDDLVQLVHTVIGLVRTEHEQSTTYAGVSTARIAAQLPPKWTLGGTAIRHPLQGSLSVAVDAGDASQFQISLSVQREDTCIRAVRATWPLFDRIRVDGTTLKSASGQAFPAIGTLNSVCTSAAHDIHLLAE